MDIDAALTRMRELNGQIDKAVEAGNKDGLAYLAYQLSIVTESIDGWLSKGGFLPADWFGKDRTL